MTFLTESTSRTSHGGVNSSGSLGARGTRANSIPLPAGSIIRIEPALKFGRLAQAMLDGTAVLLCFFFILITAASVPLAAFLLLFASF